MTDRLGDFTDFTDELVDRLIDMPRGPTPEEIATAMVWVGRLQAEIFILDLKSELLPPADELAQVAHVAWLMTETPEGGLEDLMTEVGYREDGEPATPPPEVVLYRAAATAHARDACWTASLQVARQHAHRLAVYAVAHGGADPAPSRIYRAVVPGEHLLAHIADRGEDEHPVSAEYRSSMEIEKVEIIELDDLDL